MGYNNPRYDRDFLELQAAASKLHDKWLMQDMPETVLSFNAEQSGSDESCDKSGMVAVAIETLSGATCMLHMPLTATLVEIMQHITEMLTSPINPLCLELIDPVDGCVIDSVTSTPLADQVKKAEQRGEVGDCRLQLVRTRQRQALTAACQHTSPLYGVPPHHTTSLHGRNSSAREKLAPQYPHAEDNAEHSELGGYLQCPRCQGSKPFLVKSLVKGGLISGSHKSGSNHEWCPDCGFLVWFPWQY